jgi:hypothetical protein
MSKVIDFKTKKESDGGGGDPPVLSPSQEDMMHQLLNYIDIVELDQLGCLIIAGIDKDGLAFTPAVIAEFEDNMFKASVLLKELSNSVHESCMDSLAPLLIED